MTPDQLAERIMARIERDQAIHKSSIVEELELAQPRSDSKPFVYQSIQDQITARIEAMKQRDGYPVEPSGLGLHNRLNGGLTYMTQEQRLRQEYLAKQAEYLQSFRGLK